VIIAVTEEKWRKPVFDFVAPKAHITTNLENKYSFIGFIENDKILGGLLFSDYDGHNVFVHLALDTPRVCQRRFVKMMFLYCFNQLKCSRITAMCRNGYKRNERLLKGAGFVKEGVCRQTMKINNEFVDAAIYGMLKQECKWI
jgi:RimJ/RimL family protein N-acetyltransferase